MKTIHAIIPALLLLGLCGQPVGAQPEPWVHPDGSIHYYNAVAAPAGITWSAASDSAQLPGGCLATLTSPAENDFVFGLVDSSVYWYQRPGSGDWAGPWLGGKQLFGAPEPDSGWEWAGGEPFGYRNWSPGEPDNEGNENVLNFGESSSGRISTWNDLNEMDAAIRGFVVELSAESTTIGLLQNDTNAFVGYSLFESNRARFIYLIDNKGRYVHSWYSTYPSGQSNYLLEDGSLLHSARVGNPNFPAGGSGGRVERIDWDGNQTWAYNYSNTLHCQHHDIEPLPSGNVLLVAWELKTRAEAIAAGRDSAKLTEGKLWPDHIVEVNPSNDSIVWQWHVWDHLIQDFDSTKANYGVVADHSELVDINYIRNGNTGADWIHSNAGITIRSSTRLSSARTTSARSGSSTTRPRPSRHVATRAAGMAWAGTSCIAGAIPRRTAPAEPRTGSSTASTMPAGLSRACRVPDTSRYTTTGRAGPAGGTPRLTNSFRPATPPVTTPDPRRELLSARLRNAGYTRLRRRQASFQPPSRARTGCRTATPSSAKATKGSSSR